MGTRSHLLRSVPDGLPHLLHKRRGAASSRPGVGMRLENECLPEQTPDVWPVGKKAAFYTLFLCVLFAILDFMDRQVLAALFPYLKAEYDLSDTQLGMLVSVVNVSVAVLVIPSGYLIDRWSRSKMMGIMTFTWSVATGVCAFAGSFAHLFIARLLVGAGEAGYGPASQSLMAASFPARLRTTVMSMFMFGCQIGAPLGLIAGAFIAAHWGWRHAFGLVALPGILAAGLCLFIKDYKTVRPACEAGEQRELDASYRHTLASLLSTPALLYAFLAQACTMMCSATLMNWLPSYFQRVAGMENTMASSLGALWVLSTAVATLLGGPFLDWLRHKNVVRPMQWQVLACFIAFGLVALAFIGARPGSWEQMALLMLSSLFFSPLMSLGYAVTADLSLPHQRGTAVSLITTAQNILGMAVGPLLAGMLSDHFDLRTSLVLMSSCYALAGLLYVGVALNYQRDQARLAKVVVEF